MPEIGIDGVRIGHVTDADGRTGCTVIRFDVDNVASGEVRGGAPATREFALLDPRRLVRRIDAVVLTGGSAFGLSACDGVVSELETAGQGFPTANGPVPIVVGMALYDLGAGRSDVRPEADWGRRAAAAARSEFSVGPVGAGTGATVGKWRGEPVDAGLGFASASSGDVTVAALVAVNAVGDVMTTTEAGRTVTALDAGEFVWPEPPAVGEATTIGVVITNAVLDPTGCRSLAEAAHDGLARSIQPAHTPFDGDAFVSVATGRVEADVPVVRELAAHATRRAVESTVAD